jgi:cytochrome P450
MPGKVSMTGRSATPLVLNDLPIPENRDLAWRLLAERGDSVQLDNDLAMTSQRTVEEVMRQPQIFSSKRAFDSLNSPLPLVPLAFDPPEQTRYRRILQPFFSPRSIRPLEDHLRAHIIALIEPIAERGSCEFVSEIADIFPVQTFLAFFGLPAGDLADFMVWKEAILEGSDASGAATDSSSVKHAMALFGYLTKLVQSRRGVAGEDVLSHLLCIEGDDALSDEEAIGLCFLFVLAGLDTVAGSLGFGMERLANNPLRRQELVDDPSLIVAAVEELVRLDPPAPFTPRVTTEATTIDGHELPAGSHVSTYLAVANRDQAARTHPFDVDFHRPENPHASFGLGVHRCLGSHLARLEMRLVYEEWHKRIPNYTVTPGTTPRVKWPRGTLGLESLYLTF